MDAAYFVSVTRRVSGRFRAKMLLVIACSARHLLCRTVVPNKDGWRLRNGRPFISDFSPLIFSSSFSLSLVPISFSFFFLESEKKKVLTVINFHVRYEDGEPVERKLDK